MQNPPPSEAIPDDSAAPGADLPASEPPTRDATLDLPSVAGLRSTLDIDSHDSGAPSAPGPSPLRVIERANYRVLDEVARGGIGRVFSARDPHLDRLVALKELLHGSTGAEARFLREALLTARLQHPSIIPIYEAGRWPSGEPFYTMKLVSGRTLVQAIDSCPTLERRLALLPNVLAASEAVAYAHRQRIIHRDLKPSNILVGELGETVVIDWGVAKDLSASDDADEPPSAASAPAPSTSDPPGVARSEALTAVGAVIGTPSYMPPEQAMGIPADERADVYAIGAILYHLLSGAPPYEGSSVADVLAKVVAGPPLPLDRRATGAPLDLLAIVKKAMDRDIEARYRTAAEMAEDLRRFQTGQIVAAHRYSPAERLRRFTERYRAPLAVAAAALILLVVGGAISVKRILDAQGRAEQKQNEAEASERRAIARADDLTIAQARASLEHDPNQSIELLRSLSPAWSGWGAVRTIAADADSRGVAKIVREHTAALNDVAFSPDGRLLVSVGDDKSVRVRDLQSGESRALSGHADEVWRAAFSPDGKLLATGGRDMKLHLHDLATGKERALEGHQAPITYIAFSPDGARLASRGYQEKVILWDVATGEGRALSRTNEFRLNERGCVAFSPDGKFIAFADEGGLALVDVASGQRTLFPGLAPGGVEIAFSPDGATIVTGTDDGAVRLWERATGASETLYVHAGTRAPVVAFAGRGEYIVSNGTTGTVNLWDIAARKLRRLGEHAGYIERMAVSRDGSHVVTAGADGTVRLWDIKTGGSHIFRGFAGKATSAAISPDGTRIAGASADATVRIWSAPPRSVVATVGGAHWVAFAPNGTSAAVLGEDGSVHKTTLPFSTLGSTPELPGHSAVGLAETVVWKGPPSHATPAPPGMSYDPPILYAADGEQIAIAYEDGAIRVFSEASREPRVLGGQGDEAFVIAFAPSGRLLASGGHGGAVRLWDIAAGSAKVVSQHGADVRAVAFSPDGKVIASGSMDGALRVTDALTGERKELRGHTGPILHLAFSRDGSTLLSVSYDRTFRLWDLPSGSSIVVHLPGNAVRRIRIFPDGATFASIQGENQVRFWDMRTGESRGALCGNTAEMIEAAISPEGQRIVISVQDGTTWLWDVASGEGRLLGNHDRLGRVVAFGPDGRSIAAVSFADGTIESWPDDLPTDPAALRSWLDAAVHDATEPRPGALLPP